MTYARALRWTAGAAMATTTLLISAPAHAGPAPLVRAHAHAHASAGAAAHTAASARSAPSADAAPAADVADRAFEDLAGSAAGAGRERPGRPVGEPANPETVLAARPVPARPRTEPTLPAPATSPPPEVIGALGTGPNERAADLAARMVPLGTGFALLGLGLGFMGMRLRRGP
ncbi:hypothetical protein OTB20_00095 [Streptomyces sp. H27-H1]|uniref:hypothetical protein n=1 Tax=Streptomyces sp. H27-H1 TaxID=2996461 RepID=UPI0022701581|nr:hypothetical protein [Streptomyces sp. H27-H1]MCY0924644.1 hypothetical protein [Streptomyces sp. H27-H1]